MVIAFVGQKGGVGKSTLAIFTAAELTHRGYRVLLVDADPQGTARTWGDVANEANVHTPSIVAMGATMHRPGQLDAVGDGYDVVLVDCPPRHGEIQRAALMVADVAVLPCGPSPADAWALTTSLELVSEAQVVRPHLRACIALTRVRTGTRIAQSTRTALESTGLPVLEAEIGYRVVFQEAMAAGQGLDACSTSDAGVKELRHFVDAILSFANPEEEREVADAKAATSDCAA